MAPGVLPTASVAMREDAKVWSNIDQEPNRCAYIRSEPGTANTEGRS